MNQSRIGDIGIGVCPAHKRPRGYTTVFVSGANTVLTNGKPSAIVGSVGISSCGHATVALSGAIKVKKENADSHRVGDTGTNPGPYVTVSGSPNVLVGG